MRKRSATGATLRRRPAKFATTIDPVVMRAFRKVCKRRGHRLNIVERLLVCWLRSDDWTRCDVVAAKQLFENAADRDRQLAMLAEHIKDPETQELRKLVSYGTR